MRARDSDVCVVVDTERVVLGLVGTEVLRVDATTPVEQVMQPTPVTFRPNVGVDRMPDYLKKRPQTSRALVTTSDGILIGLLRMEDVGAAREHGGA